MEDFKGKVAVITGAASGIGKALTEKCLAEGMHVVMADIEKDALEATAEEFAASGNNSILTVQVDVSIGEEIEKLLAKTLEEFGAVHLLFNNAGVGGGGNSWQATKKDWDWVLGVNLWSVIYGVQTFVPQMLKQDTECHIVNTASMAGLMGGVTNACYSVTKFGVVALTENLYQDLLAENAKVGVSVLCPGFVNTNIFNSERNRPTHLDNNVPEREPTAEEAARAEMFREILRSGMQPEELAEIVFDAIRNKRLFILTHESFKPFVTERANNIVNGVNPPASFLPGGD